MSDPHSPPPNAPHPAEPPHVPPISQREALSRSGWVFVALAVVAGVLFAAFKCETGGPGIWCDATNVPFFAALLVPPAAWLVGLVLGRVSHRRPLQPWMLALIVGAVVLAIPLAVIFVVNR